MEMPRKYFVLKRVIIWETIGILFIILIIWFDEMLDIPHLFLGAESTPINWAESIFESVIISILGIVIVCITARLLQRMKHLEGVLPICASCKRIRDEKNHWHQIEEYVRGKSDAEFSHGICPECAKKLYPEFYKNDKGKE